MSFFLFLWVDGYYFLLGWGISRRRRKCLLSTGQCCFLGFPGKFSVEARSYSVHSASVSLRLGIFKNTLCQLEHFSSEIRIVGICADQSGRNRTLWKETWFSGRVPGPSLYWTWTAAFFVYFQVSWKDLGSTLTIMQRDFKQSKKNLSKAYVCIFLSCKQKSVLCDSFKETWSCRGQFFTHSWILNLSLLCTNSLPQDSERISLEHVSHGFFSWKMLPPWEDPIAFTSEEWGIQISSGSSQ